MSELPRLSSAELVARFGNDEAALRRYRMLGALLREGRSPGEVARTFGVSRESLRRLRIAFERDGLDALQTRRRTSGHLLRGSSLAQALRQELIAEPTAPAGVLWRRVQAHLLAQGETPPRSTFYRLLGQLRDEPLHVVGGNASLVLLRDALGALVEEPPLALGRSDLAELLLPAIREPRQRGTQLQQSLRLAIEKLRPSEAGPVLDDTRWRHYLIIAGEYETGETRTALQHALALSASTYSRAKREALERLMSLLPSILESLPPPNPPPDTIAPPLPPQYFDMDAELAAYMIRLRRDGLAMIWGAASAARLSLATTLAAQLKARGQKIVWHSCKQAIGERNPGMQLLYRLAAALVLEEQRELWEILSRSETPELGRLLHILNRDLAQRRWTLIIADFHWLSGRDAAQILQVLREAQVRGDLRLVLVGRELPDWADPERWPTLPTDNSERARFLQILSEHQMPPNSDASLSALRDRIADVIAALPVEVLDSIPEAEIGRMLAALRPIEELAAELRMLLRQARHEEAASGKHRTAPQTPQHRTENEH